MTATFKMDPQQKILEQLQMTVGSCPKIVIKEFTNWAGTVQVSRVLYAVPQTVDHVKCLVVAAKDLGIRVRCRGATHSWAPVFADQNQLLLDMREMCLEDGYRIHIEKSGAKNLITAASGVSLGDLEAFQIANKVSLPANAVPEVITVGGIFSVGAHGTGKGAQTVSDTVTKMRVVAHNGQIVTYDTSNQTLLNHVKLSLGLFGVLIDVTFEVETTTKVKTVHQYTTIQSTLYDGAALKAMYEKNLSMEFFWFPFNRLNFLVAMSVTVTKCIPTFLWHASHDLVWTRLVNPTTEALSSEIYWDLVDVLDFATGETVGLIDDVMTNVISFIPLYSKIGFLAVRLANTLSTVTYLPQAHHYRKFLAGSPVLNTEFVFDVGANFEHFVTGSKILVDLVAEYAARGQFPMNISTQWRVVKASDATISPGIVGKTGAPFNGSGNVVYLGLISYVNTPLWDEFNTKLYEKLKASSIPRITMHWGKDYNRITNIRSELQSAYGSNITDFANAVKTADPSGLFRNKELESMFNLTTDPLSKAYAARSAKVGKKGKKRKRCVIQ